MSFLLLIFSLWALRHMLHDFRLRDVVDSLISLPNRSVILAFLLIGGSYLLNTVYDLLGCRWIKKSSPYWHLAPASFIGYAFGNTLGMPLVSGGSVRYRLYSSWGLTAAEVTAVVIFGMWTYILGCFFMLGLTFLLSPPAFLPIPLSPLAVHGFGFLLLATLVGYVLLNKYGPSSVRIFRRTIELPGTRLALLQIALGALTICMEASAVYFLIPPEFGVSLPLVVAAFLLSTTLGHMSQVPGGIGVMETTMLVMLSSDASRATILGVLVLFRFIYNFLPLVLAIALLGLYELFHEKGWFRAALRQVHFVSDQLVPQLIALTASAGGALLVLGGSLPPARSANIFFELVPLPFLELAHLGASLAGLRLLLLAPRLERGDPHAFRAVLWTLSLGIAAVFVRSFAVAQTVVLALLLICIMVSEPVVRRLAAPVVRQKIHPEWLLTAVTTVCGAVFLASLAYPLAFSDWSLWTHFGHGFPAGRTLRTTFVVVIVAVAWIAPSLIRRR